MTLQQSNPNRALARQSANRYMQNMTSEDFTPPQFKLVAPVAAEVADGLAKPGQWYSPELKQARDHINAALLINRKGRILWTEGEFGTPRCSSDDAVVPRAGGEFEGITCAACPMANIRDGCNISYTLLFQDLDDDFPFQVRVSSWSGRTAVQNMQTALLVSTNGIPFRRAIQLGSAQKTSGSGIKYFAPQFLVAPMDLDEDLIESLQALADGMVGTPIEVESKDTAPVEQPKTRRPRRSKAQIAADEQAARDTEAVRADPDAMNYKPEVPNEAEGGADPEETESDEDDLY